LSPGASVARVTHAARAELCDGRLMRVQFAHWRRLDRPAFTHGAWASYATAVRMDRPSPGADAAGPTRLAPAELSPMEQAQVVSCVRVLAAVEDEVPLAYEDLFSARLAEVDRTNSFADEFEAATIEWWDVVDEDGQVLYVLFMLGIGAGRLLVAGSCEQIGHVIQFDLYPATEPNPHAELWQALAFAQAEIKAQHPESELAEVAVPLD
jgi:hypothetical protein